MWQLVQHDPTERRILRIDNCQSLIQLTCHPIIMFEKLILSLRRGAGKQLLLPWLPEVEKIQLMLSQF